MPHSRGSSDSSFVNMAVKYEIQCHAVKILTNRVYLRFAMTIKQEIRK